MLQLRAALQRARRACNRRPLTPRTHAAASTAASASPTRRILEIILTADSDRRARRVATAPNPLQLSAPSPLHRRAHRLACSAQSCRKIRSRAASDSSTWHRAAYHFGALALIGQSHLGRNAVACARQRTRGATQGTTERKRDSALPDGGRVTLGPPPRASAHQGRTYGGAPRERELLDDAALAQHADDGA